MDTTTCTSSHPTAPPAIVTRPASALRTALGAAIGLLVALALVAGCSRSGAEEPARGGSDREVQTPSDEDTIDSLIDRFLPSDTSTEEVLDQLRDVLVPGDGDEDAVFAALRDRLGPDAADVDDPAELLALVADVLDVDPEAPPTVDELIQAIEDWAGDDVVRIGGTAPGSWPALGPDTSLDDLRGWPTFDGLHLATWEGIGFDIHDAVVTIDPAAGRLVIDGRATGPLDAVVSVAVTWPAGSPEVGVSVTFDRIDLAEVLHLDGLDLPVLGQAQIEMSASGTTVTGDVLIDSLPGLGGMVSVDRLPVEMHVAGFGLLGAEAPPSIEIPIDLGALAPYDDWNTGRTGRLVVGTDGVTYAETVVARFGDDTVTFVGEVSLGEDAAQVSLRMAGIWDRAFGVDWLSMSDVTLEIDRVDGRASARIAARFEAGGVSGHAALTVADGGATITFTGGLGSLGVAELERFFAETTGARLLPKNIAAPADLLSLRNVEVTIVRSGGDVAVSLTAVTTVAGHEADALVATAPARSEGGRDRVVVVIIPPRLSLGDLIPGFADDPIVSAIALPDSAIVWTGGATTRNGERTPAALADVLPGNGAGLRAGLSIAGEIPAGIGVLDDLKAAFGMDPNDPMVVAGTLPVSAGGEFAIDIRFPELSAGNGPSWFVSAELGLRITSEPSVGVVGSLTLDIGGDIQTFEIEASIGRSDRGVSIDLVGRLGNPWESPFDVEWLTLNEVALKLGIDSTGSVTLGFGGDLRIGTKDIRGAIAISINGATGAPTNFAFEARSAAGVSLADLADLYALLSGEPRPPVEAVLPDVEIRDIHILFAPQGDDDLGIEQGFRMKGELWMAMTPGAPLERLVGVDVHLSDQGVMASGFLTSIDLGPIALDETTVALEISARQQRFTFAGGIEIAGGGQQVVIDISRTALSFEATTTISGARLTIGVAAGLDLRNPSFVVTARMNEQFLGQLDEALRRILGAEITDLNSQIANAERGLDGARWGLDRARDALSVADRAARLCFWPGPCDRLDRALSRARSEVNRRIGQVRDAERRLADARALLDRYDIELRLVGADLSAGWDGFGAGSASMALLVDANGRRVPVTIDWDFARSIDHNLSGILDQFV